MRFIQIWIGIREEITRSNQLLATTRFEASQMQECIPVHQQNGNLNLCRRRTGNAFTICGGEGA